ncbi:hypothetical protein EZV62_028186 [Acer yangbiense]|uniref:ABC-2 type transporter domain-containing protein n=1 Tax=Acer yangbiense TaxID=1000413 RepID=A0A5C7GQ19_9ROSI|nr:hypothetical protein EZV62_028186 [Acer yangbiense]
MRLLKVSMDREKLLVKRIVPVYIIKTIQIIIVAIIASTVFLKTTLGVTYNDGDLCIGAMIFAMIVNMFNGFAELSIAIMRLPVFYKHRDLLFYPAWAFTIPHFLLRVPMSILESIVWTVVTYFSIDMHQKLAEASGNVNSLGVAVLEKFDVDPKEYWYWIGVLAFLGFTILFNVLFTFSLMYLNPLGKPQAMISEEEANKQSKQGGTKRKAKSKTKSSIGTNDTREMEKLKVNSQSNAQLLMKITMK